MAILYYYSIGGNDLNNASFWWNDIDHVSSAGRIPTSSDDVVILSDITNTTAPTLSAKSIQVKSAVFGNTNISNTLTITSSAVFYGLCINYFNIKVPTAYFYGYSQNRGILTGSVVFNDCSYNGSGGKYTTATFNSINNKTIGNASLVL
jgi:hypothetical protein